MKEDRNLSLNELVNSLSPEDVQICIIPADQKTLDDPTEVRGYISWKIVHDGEQYGAVMTIDGAGDYEDVDWVKQMVDHCVEQAGYMRTLLSLRTEAEKSALSAANSMAIQARTLDSALDKVDIDQSVKDAVSDHMESADRVFKTVHDAIWDAVNERAKPELAEEETKT